MPPRLLITCCGSFEKSCTAFANMQCLFHSGDEIMTRRPLISSPEQEVRMVNYYIVLSVNVRRASSSLCRQHFFSKDDFSYTPWPIDSKVGRKYRGDLLIRES